VDSNRDRDAKELQYAECVLGQRMSVECCPHFDHTRAVFEYWPARSSDQRIILFSAPSASRASSAEIQYLPST
jgi:hypothetical protein